MAYEKKTWVDRQSEYPGRRKLTATGTADVYDVTREEGLIVEEGDALNAQNLNALEGRIEAGLGEKADASHTHAPGDLTAAVPVSKGGTGAATAADALANLGAAKAADIIYKQEIGANRVKIQANSDLNSFTSVGSFACSTNSTSSTLSNCPTTVGFIMDVVSANGSSVDVTAPWSYLRQVITDIEGKKWERIVRTSGTTEIECKAWTPIYSGYNVTASTTDLTAGTSSLATGQLYLCYE